MKLGEMLIRDDRLDQATLDRAIEFQRQNGGRFGTVLVEIGAIDIDTLTVYLGLELGIPIATGTTLDRAKKTAVRLITAEQAHQYRCIPIVIQHRQLIAAIDDPHDLEVLDELSLITGYRVIPRVAPEIRIHYYLERFYGVPRTERFAAFGDSARGSAKHVVAPDLPAPPLPGLPPSNPEMGGGKPSIQVARTLSRDADDLAQSLASDSGEVAEAVPTRDKVPETTGPVIELALVPEPPLSATEALKIIGATESRGAIADAVLRYSASRFDTAVLFRVRDNMAFGWQGFGDKLRRDRLETMLIPLEGRSTLQGCKPGVPWHGNVTQSTLNSYIYRVLGCETPAYATTGVISVGSRVVNIVYAHHNETRSLTEFVLSEFSDVLRSAGDAYRRLIKLTRSEPVAPSGSDEMRQPALVINTATASEDGVDGLGEMSDSDEETNPPESKGSKSKRSPAAKSKRSSGGRKKSARRKTKRQGAVKAP